MVGKRLWRDGGFCRAMHLDACHHLAVSYVGIFGLADGTLTLAVSILRTLDAFFALWVGVTGLSLHWGTFPSTLPLTGWRWYDCRLGRL